MYDILLIKTKKEITMRPLQISAETALKLSKSLNMPLEQIMHMPQHILLAKLAEVQKQEEQEMDGQTKKES